MVIRNYYQEVRRDFLIAPYLYYGSFLFLSWVIHLLLISLVSSIHFSLGHDLQITEEWIYGRAWELISLSQLFAFGIVFKFFRGEGIDGTWKNILQITSWGHYKKRTLVIVLYFFSFFILISRGLTSIDSSVSIWGVLVHSIGLLVTVATYFIWMLLVINTFIASTTQRILFVTISSIATFMVFQLVTLYSSASAVVFFILLTTSFSSMIGQQYQWNIGSIILLLVLLPICAFLGFDPIYAQEQSWWCAKSKTFDVIFLIPMFISIFYIYKRRTE